MNERSLSWSRQVLVFPVIVLAACAARGPSYPETMSKAAPLEQDQFRIVFLRPKDKDDGGNGGAATVFVDDARLGGLQYGGFFYADFPLGAHAVDVSGRYRAFGACQLQLNAAVSATVYVDVGPRKAYMVAGLVGTVVGAVAGVAAAPDTYGYSTQGIASAVVPWQQMAVSSGVETAAILVEASDKPCGGPYQLVPIPETDALARLQELAWSK